jgi:uncharacterized protein
MRRFLQFLTSVLPFLAAELIQYVVVVVLAIFYSFIQGWGTNRTLADITNTNLIALPGEVLYLCSATAILVCGIIFYFWYRLETFGEAKASLYYLLNGKTIGFFLLLGVGSQLFFSGLMSLLTPYLEKVFSDYSKIMQQLLSGQGIVVVILTVVVAPIAEELIFRGVILHMANRYITFAGANLLQAILFGIYHGNLVQGIYAGLLGLLLGIMYYKYNSVLAPVLLHMIINASAFFTFLIPDTILGHSIMIVIGTVAVFGIIVLMKPWEKAPLEDK